MNITVSVSVGELLDKVSILRIKSLKIKTPSKVNEVLNELEILENKMVSALQDVFDYEVWIERLMEINYTLWDVEDRLRVLEREKNFGEEFVELARKVYYTNDERFKVKNAINDLTGSNIKEVKSYQQYQ